jgi:hypothetical protein
MKVRVDRNAGTVYIELQPAEVDRNFATTYWRKFGVFPHWDGRGGLIGMEFTGVTNVDVEEVNGLVSGTRL